MSEGRIHEDADIADIMSNTAGSLPRRRSMTDAFFYFCNPDAANAARGDLINMVEEMR